NDVQRSPRASAACGLASGKATWLLCLVSRFGGGCGEVIRMMHETGSSRIAPQDSPSETLRSGEVARRVSAVPKPPPLLPAPRGSWRRRLARRLGAGGLVALRDEVRERLAEACDVERRPPERYGFSRETAAWLFTVTGAFYRWYFRTCCYGIET